MVLSQILVFILFEVVSLKVPVGKTIYSTYGESILTGKERTLYLAHMKLQILTLMQLMQPQAGIDELELEAILQILLYLLFQWLALFQQMNSGSHMDL